MKESTYQTHVMGNWTDPDSVRAADSVQETPGRNANAADEVDVAELVNREYRERNRRANEAMAEGEMRKMEAESIRLAKKEHERYIRAHRCRALRLAAAGALYLAAGAGMIFAMTVEMVSGGIAIALAVIWAMKAAVRLQKAKEAWPA